MGFPQGLDDNPCLTTQVTYFGTVQKTLLLRGEAFEGVPIFRHSSDGDHPDFANLPKGGGGADFGKY